MNDPLYYIYQIDTGRRPTPTPNKGIHDLIRDLQTCLNDLPPDERKFVYKGKEFNEKLNVFIRNPSFDMFHNFVKHVSLEIAVLRTIKLEHAKKASKTSKIDKSARL